jgi:4-amino-4-deoxy-L-arabinose transferase-like glycosyltransferase
MQLFFDSARQKITRTWVVVLVILLIAAFFRFYRLNEIPPGFNNDEAFNVLDILNLLKGHFSIFFPANTGREPLWFYLNVVSVALFGANAFALRFTAAIVGTLTILLLFGFAKELFHSRRIAVIASLLGAVSVWQIFYSRYGLRIILAVPLTILALQWFWRGLTFSPVKRGEAGVGNWRDYALSGFFTSLGVYTYLSCRLLPFVLILLTGFAMLANRSRAREYWKGLVIAGVVALIVFLPLGAYFVAHPADFIGHSANLSIFDPRVNKGNIPQALWDKTVSVVGMFLVMGDHQGYRNVPNRPVFDPFIGAFFVIGVAIMLFTLFARRSAFHARLCALLLALWMAFFMLSSIASDDAPSFLRTLPAMPAAMMLAAWGASELWDRLRGATMRRAAAGAFGVMMLTSAALGFRDYFDFGTSGIAYLSFDTHVADTAKWLNANASTSEVFLAPLWAQQGTMQVMTRNLARKSYESRDSVILPGRAAGRDAVIVYPWEQEKKAQTLGERLGALGTRTDIVGSAGFPVAIVYRVLAQNLPDAQHPLDALARGGAFIQPQHIEHAVWDNKFELLGYSVDAADSAKRNLEVTLFFHALEAMHTDYTFSVKVRDARDRTWGQEDKWAGDNSYNTTVWSPGDVIIEKFYPGLNACAPAGDYRITVEAYDPRTLQVLRRSDGAGNLITLGTTHADASPSNRLEDLEIDQNLDTDVAPQLHLLGFTLTPNQARAGEAFSLSLFWRGAGSGSITRNATIHLRDSTGRDFPLAEPPVIPPAQGRGLCTFLDLRAPSDAAAGAATIFVNNTRITTFNIER